MTCPKLGFKAQEVTAAEQSIDCGGPGDEAARPLDHLGDADVALLEIFRPPHDPAGGLNHR